MKKHKLLSISAVIMMLSAYGCSLDEFNPSGISTEQEWSTPAGYEKKVNDCYFDLDRKSTRLNSSHNRESRMPSSA